MIELMIAIALLGILSAIAYPAYKDSIRKTRRADGVTAALAIQVAQEKYRGSCPTYAQNLGAANVCATSTVAPTLQLSGGNYISPDGWYVLSIAAGSASGSSYTINAVPQGDQAADTCATLTITFSATNPNGVKGQTGSGDCW